MLINLYKDRHSIIHKTPFLLKVFIMSLMVSTMYLKPQLNIIVICLALTMTFYLIAHISLIYYLKMIFLMLPILLTILAINITITHNIIITIAILIRIIVSLGIAYLVSVSTPMKKILKECTILFLPLRIIGIPSTIPAFLVMVTLRCIPLFTETFDALKKAYALRGGKKRRTFILIIPLLIQSLQQCDTYSFSLTLRGFNILL